MEQTGKRTDRKSEGIRKASRVVDMSWAADYIDDAWENEHSAKGAYDTQVLPPLMKSGDAKKDTVNPLSVTRQFKAAAVDITKDISEDVAASASRSASADPLADASISEAADPSADVSIKFTEYAADGDSVNAAAATAADVPGNGSAADFLPHAPADAFEDITAGVLHEVPEAVPEEDPDHIRIVDAVTDKTIVDQELTQQVRQAADSAFGDDRNWETWTEEDDLKIRDAVTDQTVASIEDARQLRKALVLQGIDEDLDDLNGIRDALSDQTSGKHPWKMPPFLAAAGTSKTAGPPAASRAEASHTELSSEKPELRSDFPAAGSYAESSPEKPELRSDFPAASSRIEQPEPSEASSPDIGMTAAASVSALSEESGPAEGKTIVASREVLRVRSAASSQGKEKKTGRSTLEKLFQEEEPVFEEEKEEYDPYTEEDENDVFYEDGYEDDAYDDGYDYGYPEYDDADGGQNMYDDFNRRDRRSPYGNYSDYRDSGDYRGNDGYRSDGGYQSGGYSGGYQGDGYSGGYQGDGYSSGYQGGGYQGNGYQGGGYSDNGYGGGGQDGYYAPDYAGQRPRERDGRGTEIFDYVPTRNPLRFIPLVLVIAICVFGFIAAMQICQDVPLNASDYSKVKYTVDAGLTDDQLAQDLVALGIIDNPLVFRLRCVFYSADYVPGTYELSPCYSTEKIINILSGYTYGGED